MNTREMSHGIEGCDTFEKRPAGYGSRRVHRMAASAFWASVLSLFLVTGLMLTSCGGSDWKDPAEPVSVVTKVAEQPQGFVAYGKEFWNGQGMMTATGEPNLNEIVERADAAFRVDAKTGAVQARGRGFKATVNEDGLRFVPAVPKGSDATEIEVDLQTAAIRRGERGLLDKRAGHWSVLGNTAQRRLDEDGKVLEHYETRRGHMAVTWVLQEAPTGEGDVSIEYTIGTLTARSQSKKGWVFADKEGKDRLRLGAAVAVDANGTRWPLTTVAEANTARIALPEDVLAKAAFPLAIDPVIGAVRELPTDIVSVKLRPYLDSKRASMKYHRTRAFEMELKKTH